MVILEYMSNVLCHDGKERTWSCAAVFADHKALEDCLICWDGRMGPNGSPYRYWVAADQKIRNARQRPVEGKALPGLIFTICHVSGTYAERIETPSIDRLTDLQFALRIEYRKRITPKEMGRVIFPPKYAH